MKSKSNYDYGDSYNYSQNKKYEDIYSSSKNKRKKKIIINVTICILSIILAVGGALMVYAYNMLDSMNYDNGENDSQGNESSDVDNLSVYSGNLLNDPMVLNIMLFGSDSYSVGDGGRTDTMLMLSIDNRHKKLKLTSFMRDMWIQIPNHGSDRLNAAYAINGPALAMETIERNMGVHIDRYAVADFVGFEKIVNNLGGIDMYLTQAECEYLNTYSNDPNPLYGEGMHHLSGLQALNHARNRNSLGSDFDRTSRQRDVISTIVNKMKTSNIAQITSIISQCGPLITTNIKKNEITTLAPNALTYLNYEIEELRIPEPDNYSNIVVNGAQVLGINDMERCRYDLARFIYEDSIKETEKTLIYSQSYDDMLEKEKNGLG